VRLGLALVLVLAMELVSSGGARACASPSLSVHSSVSLTLIKDAPSSSVDGGLGRGPDGGGFAGAWWRERVFPLFEACAK